MTDHDWISEAELQAYLDGALDADRQHAVAEYLAEHPDQGARLEAYRRHRGLMRRAYMPILERPLPAAALVAVAGPRRRRWLAIAGAAAAALALFAAGAASGWWVGSRAPVPVSNPLVADALSAHHVYAVEVRHPVEVGADQKDHLVTWLSRRLDLPITAPDLTAQGYALVGGRLLPAATGPAAQLMYQDADGRRITLYVRASEEPEETAFRFVSDGDLAALYWREGGAAWALLGKLPHAELVQLGHAVYRSLNP